MYANLITLFNSVKSFTKDLFLVVRSLFSRRTMYLDYMILLGQIDLIVYTLRMKKIPLFRRKLYRLKNSFSRFCKNVLRLVGFTL